MSSWQGSSFEGYEMAIQSEQPRLIYAKVFTAYFEYMQRPQPGHVKGSSHVIWVEPPSLKEFDLGERMLNIIVLK